MPVQDACPPYACEYSFNRATDRSCYPPLSAQNAASAVMNHILGLDEHDRQSVINNLLLMGLSGSPSVANDTPQINAIRLDFAHIITIPSTVPSPLFNPAPLPPPFVTSLASLPLSTAPLPRPPRSPRCPCSPRIVPPPLPVVEDDKSPRGGVKTSPLASVLALVKPTNESPHQVKPTIPCKHTLLALALNELPPQTTPTPPPRPQRSPLRKYRPIFLPNVFKRPREPDKITPQAPRPPPMPWPMTQCRHTNAADTAPPQQLASSETTRPPARPVVTHDHD
ncbi:hypothetical protein EDB86DRAFT_3083263 [Lactarius hatsudake]|nr:hypothetical protein EDB86DRAFT_3083263 [Lactarius hatsudake]